MCDEPLDNATTPESGKHVPATAPPPSQTSCGRLLPVVVPLPMPPSLRFDGIRLPASYANFYVCNAAVLVPTYNDPNDRIANRLAIKRAQL